MRTSMRTSVDIMYLLAIIIVIVGIANYQQHQHERDERQCPGSTNIAPRETIIDSYEALSYQIRHNGIKIGPDRVSFSVTDPSDNNRVVFGGTVWVKTSEPFIVSGVDFKKRGSDKQMMTGELFTLIANDQNACIEVKFP